MHAPQWSLSYTPSPTTDSLLFSQKKYRVGIVREEVSVLCARDDQGTNCDREMVAAFFKSGLEPWLITISDLMANRTNVSNFSGLVFCGGFSFGVVAAWDSYR